MYVLLMVFFVILCVFLGGFILIQQGKGDFGLSNMSGNQMLFGGSGGREFFEKATWILGALFIFGALGLTIIKSRQLRKSMLEGVTYKPVTPETVKAPADKSEKESMNDTTGLDTQTAQNETAEPVTQDAPNEQAQKQPAQS